MVNLSLNDAFAESRSFEEYVGNYFGYLSSILEKIDKTALRNLLGVLVDARARGSAIYFLGNGGSASTASHWANDFGKGLYSPEKHFRALSLSDNVAWITALGNDDGYDSIFSGQLRALIKPNDVVIGISASGNSPNVIAALELANSAGATSVALVGFDGGKMKGIAKLTILIQSNKGEYGPVEDAQMILDHLLATYLMFESKGNK